MKEVKKAMLVLISAVCMCFAYTGCSEKKAPEPKKPAGAEKPADDSSDTTKTETTEEEKPAPKEGS